MRLKAIRLAGFKSFVDPTMVPFPANMTAVVGPNGCGKSNVIDAVRWVMGESSAKQLRGESMTDVIFNGSTQRRPSGQCSVELIFDNTDRTLIGQYAAYDEVSVKRVVTRDGQSNYYLNQAKCRRRDITDLFLGTGLGPRSYAIIEQGMISRLIESKPDELRVYIEEAAGISRYKERRKETQQRIKRTHDNLTRLTDLRDELARQLSNLESQAKTAQTYKVLKAEERQKRAELIAMQWQAQEQKQAALADEYQQLTLALTGMQTEQVSGETALEQLDQRQKTQSDHYERRQQAYYQAGTEVAKAEQALSFARQQSERANTDLSALSEQISELEERLELDQTRIETLQDEQHALDTKEADEQVQTLEARIEQYRQRLEQAQSELVRMQSAAGGVEAERAAIGEQIANLQRRRSREQARLANMSSADSSIDQGAYEAAEVELAREKDVYEEVSGALAQANDQWQALTDQLEADRQQRETLLAKQASVKAELAQIEGRLAAMRASSADQWLAKNGLETDRLVDLLKLKDSRWQPALMTVLGHLLAAPVSNDLARFRQRLVNAQDVEVLALAKLATPVSARPDSLASMVDAPVDLTPWLNDVICVDSLEAGTPHLEAGHSIVLADGTWQGAHFIGKRQGENTTTDWQGQAEQLAEQLDELEAQLEDEEVAIDSLQLQRNGLVQKRQELAQAEPLQRQSLDQAQAHFNQLHSEYLAANSQQQAVAEAREQLVEELEEIAIELEELDMRYQGLEEGPTHDDQQAKLSEQIEHWRLAIGEQESSLAQARDQRHQLDIRATQLNEQISGANNALSRTKEQLTALVAQKQSAEQATPVDQDEVEQASAALEEAMAQQAACQTQMAEAKAALAETEQAMATQRNELKQISDQQLALRQKIEQCSAAMAGVESRLVAINEQLTEADVNVQLVLQNMPSDANEGQWKQRVSALKMDIERLGPINLAAIDEFEVQNQRKAYLDKQNDELMRALATLEDAIERIDNETKSRFEATFNAINAGMSQLFPKVFGGGTAWLALTEDDLLTTGVSIMARPPGKKNSTIHLLSGGEKALTALALVFAIFQLNPAPFCMLDEVDAPLDDANVGRYAELVSTMSNQVQFIYITHNKVAMEKAHRLVGVTMNEPGVSRPVTVNLEQAAALAEV